MTASLTNSRYVDKVWEQFRTQVNHAKELFANDPSDELITEFSLQDGEFLELSEKFELPDAPFKSIKEALKFAVKFN